MVQGFTSMKVLKGLIWKTWQFILKHGYHKSISLKHFCQRLSKPPFRNGHIVISSEISSNSFISFYQVMFSKRVFRLT